MGKCPVKQGEEGSQAGWRHLSQLGEELSLPAASLGEKSNADSDANPRQQCGQRAFASMSFIRATGCHSQD